MLEAEELNGKGSGNVIIGRDWCEGEWQYLNGRNLVRKLVVLL